MAIQYDGVRVVDANGNPATLSPRTSVATQTSVASSATSVTLLAANANRIGVSIFNDSTQILYVLPGSAAASATAHSVQVAAGGYYQVPFGYTGQINGIWAAAAGAARVTEWA